VLNTVLIILLLENPYIELVVAYLNVIIFDKDVENSSHDEAWTTIQSNILAYFDLKQESKKSSELKHLSKPLVIRDTIWQFSVLFEDKETNTGNILLFDRIRNLMGFKINKTFLDRIYRGSASQLKVLVMPGIGQKIKHMNIISHAEGWLLRPDDPELALKKFDIARNSLPLNKFTLRNYAKLVVDLEEKKRRGIQKDNKHGSKLLNEIDFVKYTEYLYNLALEEDPKDTHSLYQYGHFLNKTGQYGKAEEFLIQAIEAHPLHKEAWNELLQCFSNSQDAVNYEKFVAIFDAKFNDN